MDNNIVIRQLQVSDVEKYRSIRLSALKTSPEAFGSVYEIENQRPLEQFEERISTTMIWAAFDGDNIVGMLGFRRHAGLKDIHKGYIWGTYVDPKARGKGVGYALGSRLLQEVAKIEGLEQLLLGVVEDNKSALALYKRLGFVEYGLEPNALKVGDRYWNEVLMVLFLSRMGDHHNQT